MKYLFPGHPGIISQCIVKHAFINVFALCVFVFLFSAPHLSSAVSSPKKTAPPDFGQKFSSGSYLSEIASRLKNPEKSALSSNKLSAAENDTYLNEDKTGITVFMGKSAVSGLVQPSAGKSAKTSFAATALEIVSLNKDVFHIDNPAQELRLLNTGFESSGDAHVQFGQVYNGVPFWGNRLTVHFGQDGSVYAVTGRYSRTPVNIDVTAVIDSLKALDIALKDVYARTGQNESGNLSGIPFLSGKKAAGIVIYTNPETGKQSAAWNILITVSLKDRWRYFIDTGSGEILEAYNTVMNSNSVSATAKDALGTIRSILVEDSLGVYYLHDMTANISTYTAGGKVINADSDVSLISSKNNTWSDSIAVSAHANARTTYDYYYQKFGRLGLDNHNMEMPLIVHYTPDGKPYINAFWSGAYMAFGDGLPFASSLDVVAHELTHGVVEFTAGLDSKYQPGALNEAVADIMACMVDPNWLLGEVLPGGPIRDVENPHRFNMPAIMSEYVNTSLTDDNGGVHTNMSIPSRAFAVLSDSIGRDKAAAILYRDLNALYLTPESQFVDMRLASEQSAKDLYGDNSAELSQVKSAFDLVGILEGAPTTQPQDNTPPVGGEWIAFDYNGVIAIGKTEIKSDSDIIYKSTTPIYEQTASPFSAGCGGTDIVFVDQYNNIRKIDLNTLKEYLIDNAGHWSSVALSNDCKHLAATTFYADSTIYIFDLVTPANSTTLKLYNPSSEGVKSYTTLYADKLDWNYDSNKLIYDCYNSIPAQGGSPIKFWTVNLYDLTSGLISHVKTPNENIYQVGNPSFAEVNDSHIVCDLFNENIGYNSLATFDLFDLKMNVVRDNGYYTQFNQTVPNISDPKYSPDGKTLIYHHFNISDGITYLYKIPLADDNMTPAGDAVLYHAGSRAVWFVKSGGTSVEETGSAVSMPFSLEQNFPNPFNASTTIFYNIYKPGKVTLKVYDILGRQAAVLTDGFREPGRYSAVFGGEKTGSGVYFYSIESDGKSEIRKMTMLK